MPGDVGLVAKLLDTVFSFFTDENGLREMRKRSLLASKRKECQRALLEHRFDDLRRLTDELQRLSDEA